jgi:CheY-like chemotaxis protein
MICYDADDVLSTLGRLRQTITFVDLGMPVMDGYQFAQAARLRRRIGTLRSIVLTRWSEPKDLPAALKRIRSATGEACR